MGPSDPDALDRARRQADRRYNDALTAVDEAIVSGRTVPPPPSVPPAGTAASTAPLAAATGEFPVEPPWWRGGRFVRELRRWLHPLFDRQRRFNVAVASELDAAGDRDRATRAALAGTIDALWARFAVVERFETALIVFLQQITAFVDSKDQQVAGDAAARLAAHDAALQALPDLSAQVVALQRATQMLKRELGAVVSPAGRGGETAPLATRGAEGPGRALEDFKYVAFEDRFRGSDEEIREKLRAYLPIFADTSDVLDLGCGRGEFLALLVEAGVSARGVDANHEMAAAAGARGLDVTEGDALAYLASLPDGSLGGLMAAQVVEHLEPAYLMRLLDTAFQKLRPGAPVVFETINPACWLAFFSSYIRDFTHVRPVHPETLQFLLQASGFGRASIRYSAPVPDHMKMKPVELPASVAVSIDPSSRALVDASRVINANAAILNNLLFSHLDYAAIAFRS